MVANMWFEGQARTRPPAHDGGASPTRAGSGRSDTPSIRYAGMDRVDDGGAIHSVHPAFPGNYRL
jgi:hypothetical protein